MRQIKFCPNCGSPIVNANRFCTKCGIKFEIFFSEKQEISEQSLQPPEYDLSPAQQQIDSKSGPDNDHQLTWANTSRNRQTVNEDKNRQNIGMIGKKNGASETSSVKPIRNQIDKLLEDLLKQ
jgi:hypothetical protein